MAGDNRTWVKWALGVVMTLLVGAFTYTYLVHRASAANSTDIAREEVEIRRIDERHIEFKKDIKEDICEIKDNLTAQTTRINDIDGKLDRITVIIEERLPR